MKKAIIQGLAALLILTNAQAITICNVTSRDVTGYNTTFREVKVPQIGRLYLPLQYWQWMQAAGRNYGVDPFLICATSAIESRFNPRAASGHGKCRGLMQLHIDTARQLGVNPWDPQQNIQGGAQVLGRLLRKFNGDLRRVYRRYNAEFTPAYYREIMKAWRQAKRNMK